MEPVIEEVATAGIYRDMTPVLLTTNVCTPVHFREELHVRVEELHVPRVVHALLDAHALAALVALQWMGAPQS